MDPTERSIKEELTLMYRVTVISHRPPGIKIGRLGDQIANATASENYFAAPYGGDRRKCVVNQLFAIGRLIDVKPAPLFFAKHSKTPRSASPLPNPARQGRAGAKSLFAPVFWNSCAAPTDVTT